MIHCGYKQGHDIIRFALLKPAVALCVLLLGYTRTLFRSKRPSKTVGSWSRRSGTGLKKHLPIRFSCWVWTVMGRKVSDMRCWKMEKLFAPIWFTGEDGFGGINNELTRSTVNCISLHRASVL